ncbi:MAG: class I SAM-dependent methyltransferase [Actinomycetota bacterium]|nr:class I SAM-dependent methyltransferase [Actinomycetota bacterium]
MPASSGPDCWSEWLLRRRFGSDPDVERLHMERLRATRDRVLDRAELGEQERLLDVGCGDGLVAFGALERGASLAIFSDISHDLLDECRRLAMQLGVVDRCRFIHAAADDLGQIETEFVDVVTTRSVLIYVDDKSRAFSEFHRVLRPGGRVSLFEPINRINRFLLAYDATEVGDLEDRVKGVFDALQPRDRDPMLNFDDRDLVELAEAAGFERVYLTLEIETEPPEPLRWEAYANMAWNPKIPTLKEAMEQVLTPEERIRYEAHMRPLVEAGRGSRRMASAYLCAIKGR